MEGEEEKKGREKVKKKKKGLSREEFGQKVLQTAAKFNFRHPQVTNASAFALEQSSWEGPRGHSPATASGRSTLNGTK